MSEPEPEPRLRLLHGASLPLYKQNSWSPDIIRDEAWTTRRKNHRLRRSRSVTDDDLDELSACLDLGFNLDSPNLDPKLTSTFPALKLYRAVNQQYYSCSSRSSSSSFSDSGSTSGSGESPSSIVDPGDDPAIVKSRLKRWAQVVACSVRHSSPNFFGQNGSSKT